MVAKADVVFAVDRSLPLAALSRASNLISSSVAQYTLSADSIRVGLAQFDSNANILLPLNKIDEQALVSSLTRLTASSNTRNIPRALNQIRTAMLSSQERPGVKRSIVLFVQGPSDAVDSAALKAEADELKRANIDMLIVYVGDSPTVKLQPLATTQYNIQRIASYLQMPFALQPILMLRGDKPGTSVASLWFSS